MRKDQLPDFNEGRPGGRAQPRQTQLPHPLRLDRPTSAPPASFAATIPLELLAQVRALDLKVGYATVYRTLKLMAESGIAYERAFGDGLTRYELAGG